MHSEERITTCLSYDIVIATYNRPKLLGLLLDDLTLCSNPPERIIVVDSSDSPDARVIQRDLVYHHTEYKCQPFQRYLGLLLSQSEIVLFLDDDLRVTDLRFAERLLALYREQRSRWGCGWHGTPGG